MDTDRCDSTCRQKYRAEGSGEEPKIHVFMYKDTMNVEPEMKIIPIIKIGATRIVTKGLRKIWKLYRKTFNRFTTNNSYTWNITHNTESTAV
jgi:hypothetical protein